MLSLFTKLKKGLIILSLAALGMPLVAYFVVQIPSVQTLAVHWVTAKLQAQLPHAAISVDAVHFSFFNKLVVTGIFVGDIQGDTVLYAGHGTVAFSGYDLFKANLTVSSVSLHNGVFNVATTRTGSNIREVLTGLKSRDSTSAGADTAQAAPRSFNVNSLSLSNFRFTHRNLRNPGNPVPPNVINFKDLALSEIFIDLRHVMLRNDTVFFHLRDLSFREKSGYCVRSLTAGNVYVSSRQILLDDVKIDDTHSLVRMKSYAMAYDHFRDFNRYVENVRMTADFSDTRFSFHTINYFAPGFHVTGLTLSLDGLVSGPVEDLRSDSLRIGLPGGATQIATSFKMTGLPFINETRISLDIDSLRTSAGDLAHILRCLIKDDYRNNTDQMLQTFGDIRYRGTLTGLYNDFVACGTLNTSLGDAWLDMLFHPAADRSYVVEGEARIDDFHFGKLLRQQLLGPVSAGAFATLVFNPASGEDFCFTLNGTAPAVTFNRYRYTNVKLDGVLSNRDFKGRVKCDDPNLSMDFDGYVAFDDGRDSTFALRHNYTAHIYYANLFRLKFNTRDTISELKANVAANYQYAGRFDAGTGRIGITDIFYHDPVGVHQLGTLSLLSSFRDSTYTTQLRANFADADFRGNHSFFQFLKDLSYAGYSHYLPSLSDSVAPPGCRNPDYELKLQIKKPAGVVYLLHPELFVAENTQLYVRLTPDRRLTATFGSPLLALGNDWMRHIAVDAQNSEGRMDVALRVGASEFFGIPVNNISGQIRYNDNRINTTLAYDNNSKPSNKGTLHFNTLLSRPAPRKNPLVALHILPSEIILNDTLWHIKSSPVTIDNEVLQFNRFQISNQRQRVIVDGAVSHRPEDSLSVRFHNCDLSNFNAFTAPKGYYLKGALSGEARFTGLYDTLLFFTRFDGKNLALNQHPLGDLAWQSYWDNKEKLFRVQAGISENNTQQVRLAGAYIPRTELLDVDLTLNHFKAVHIEPLLQKVLTNLDGYLSGNLQVRGSRNAPVLYGRNVVLDSVSLTVDYLKTHYLLTVPVEITPNAISIHNALVRDATGGKGILNGTLQHRHFKNIKYDLSIQPENMLCLNTTAKDNDAFYGKAYATGFIQISGDDEQTKFDITATTGANTVVYIPLQSRYQTKENSMLTFVEPQKDEANEWRPRHTTLVKPGRKMTFNLNLAATPNAEVQIVFDQKAGDIIRGRGSGNITFNINPETDRFDLYGDYSIEQGDYFFTLQNIISKKFIMEQGSRIAFNGDISKTTLDITGLYKTKASLSTLTEDTSSVSRVRRNVDCKIYITGNLFTPALSYNVEVQNLDPSIRAQVQSALNTEEKMTRQFLSLLAFNSFMPDQQSGISSVNISASTSELLSNQLSNMFTQLNIPLEVGVMYNFSEQGNSLFDVALSTQLFDNRVAINGAFGNGKKTTAENSFTGNLDLDLELKIDPQGRFRAKAFTHSADQFSDQFDNSQRSGVGFVYQEDFNTFRELFNRWFGKKKKQKETATAPQIENKENK